MALCLQAMSRVRKPTIGYGRVMGLRAALGARLTEDQRGRLRRLRRPAWLGVSRQTKPISPAWGSERGTPVGRWYFKRFLDSHESDIKGHVLEVRTKLYSSQYPGVSRIDVLDIDPDLPEVTVIADLENMPQVPTDTYDCIILTAVLYYIRDVDAALRELRRVLRSGGVLLSAHSGIPGHLTQLSGFESEFGYLSTRGTTTLFNEAFGADHVTVQTWGNVLACLAFLRGVAAEEVGERRLLTADPYFPQTITVRAIKSA